MVKRLHPRASGLPQDKEQPGCMWGMLRLLGFHHNLHGHKKLLVWKWGVEGGGVSGLKDSKFEMHSDSEHFSYDAKNEKTISAARNKKSTPSSPRLIRTPSIHHLECSDYVIPKDIGTARTDIRSLFCKQKDDSPKNASIHMDQISRYHDGSGKNKYHEIHDKVTKEDCCQHETVELKLVKNLELDHPVVEGTNLALLENQNLESTVPITNDSLFKDGKPSDVSKYVDAKMKNLFTNTQDPYYLELNNDQDFRDFSSNSVLVRSRSCPRTRQRSTSKNDDQFPSTYDNSFSLRGFSGKNFDHNERHLSSFFQLQIDNGQVLSQASFNDVKDRLRDIFDENKKGWFIAMDGILDRIPLGHNISYDSGDLASSFKRGRKQRNAISHLSRSHSLSDSLERYSSLLHSHSNSKRNGNDLQKEKSTHEDGSAVARRKSPVLYGRIHSLPDFLEEFSERESVEASCVAPLITKKEADLSKSSSVVDTDVLEYQNEKQEGEVMQRGNKQSMSSENNSEIVDPCEEFMVFPKQDCSLDDAKVNEDFISPKNVLEGQFHFGYHQEVHSISNIPPADDTVQEKFNICGQALETCAILDNKDDANFNYVMDILTKTGFYGSSRKHHSPQLPLNPMVFKELEGLSFDTEICSLDADIDLNHWVLFDLVNEILVSLYEVPSSTFPWQPCSDFHVKLSTDFQCQKEVWARVSQLLRGSSSDFDYHVSQDLTKKDGWYYLKLEVEDVQLEVENKILDDLLEELISTY